MGHLRIRNMFKSRKWREVIDLLELGADVPTIAAKSLEASKSGLQKAANDTGLIYSFWLLTQLPLAAKNDYFAGELRRLGLRVDSNQPTLMEIVGAFSDAVDRHVRREGERSDLGEMAHMAATESLMALVSGKTRSLLDTEAGDVQQAIRSFGTRQQFGQLGRDFIARLTRRFLNYFFSTEFSNHVGRNKRFTNISEHTEFSNALDLHCRQASRIVEEFAGGWFTKTDFEGGITEEKAKRFLHVAMKKFGKELERGEAIEEN